MTFPRGFNLRQRLSLLLLLAAVPGMIVAALLTINALASQSRQIESSAAELADLQAAQHGAVMESARIMLDTLHASQAFADIERAECSVFFSDWIDAYPSFTSLILLDADGQVVCASRVDEIPVVPAQRPWFREVQSARGFTVGQYTLGRDGTPLVIAGRPIRDANDAFAGALAVTIDLRWLEFLARRVVLPAGATVTALAADGSVLVHHVAPSGDGGEDAAKGPVPALDLRRQMTVRTQGTLRGQNQAGEPRVYGFHRSDSGGLVVAVGMPPYLTFGRYGGALRDTLVAPLAVLVLALAAAWWGAEHLITRWVRSLTRTTRQLAGGDLGVRSKVPHDSAEIGQLAAAFDHMADTIQDNQRQLREALRERETLLQELNHRVKNNMQMVVSLLNLHDRQVADSGHSRRLDDIRRRIHALARIHDLLFQGQDAPQMAGPDYPERFCQSLRELYRSEARGITVELAIEPVRLSPNQAIPFGLIVSELVANAHKHAFRDGETGRIRIAIRVERDADGRQIAHLTVADDGVGPPAGTDPLAASSTGLQIVRGLTGQLDGTLAFAREDGWTEFRVRFPVETAPTD